MKAKSGGVEYYGVIGQWGAHCWDYYHGNLSLSQVTAINLNVKEILVNKLKWYVKEVHWRISFAKYLPFHSGLTVVKELFNEKLW